MKYIKTYESSNNIKVGDYVIFTTISNKQFLLSKSEELNTFLLNNIGQVILKDDNVHNILYTNIPKELTIYFFKSYLNVIIGKKYGAEIKKVTNKSLIDTFNTRKDINKFNI